ncbi:MAG: head GIN domain-containing protein [Bacteroidota bacterium]
MKKSVFLLVALSLFLSVCLGQTEIREVRDFSKVSVRGSFDVVLEKGTSPEVRLELENISSDEIITEVDGNTLVIKQKEGSWRKWRQAKVKAYVTYESLEGISNGGSGNLRCDTELAAKDFRLRNAGSGNIYLSRLDVDELDASLSGSSNLMLGGRADDVTLSISGSGNVKAFELESETVDARVSGSGNLDVTANEDIRASVSGSGNIRYKGNASVSSMRSSGSGSIRKV